MLHLPVSQRNLVIPSIIFITFIAIIFLSRKFKFFLVASTYALIAITLADLYRFHHKFTPYSDSKYWYPPMKFIQFLQDNQGIDRNFGIFDGQLNLPFRVYSTDGYDTLFPQTYGQLLNLDSTDRVSSASLPKNSPQTMDLLNLLGVKYVIQGVVHGGAPWELQLWLYPDQFTKIYEDERYEIHQNLQVLPRVYLTDSTTPINVASFTPNRIALNVNSPTVTTLILSDNYYPGWQATIDNQLTTIQKSAAGFRGVNLSAGQHHLVMTYQPLSFTLGLWVSGISLTLLIILTIIRPKALIHASATV